LISVLTGAEEETDDKGRIARKEVPTSSAAQSPAAQAQAQAQAAAQETGPEVDELSIGMFNPGANPADGQLLEKLQNEPENDYYDRIHKEYSQARVRAGQGPDRMTHEQFVAMVSASEQQLAQKYSLPMVRFQVTQQGDRVVFRAIPIA